MVGEQTLFPVLRLWLVLILLIATFGNPKLAAAISEHAGRKLATDIPVKFQGFISIDCGASEEYRDEVTGIWYKTDAGFINSGNNKHIFPDTSIERLPNQSKTIRIFPEGRKNCYKLKPEGGKNKRYLMRALFKYGNYDGKNRGPIFDLYLGVNKWYTLNLTNPTDYTYAEIMHVPLADTIDVCLVNTDSGVPLISVLELRPVDSSLYQTEFGTLNLFYRYDVGLLYNDVSVRYPGDVYDRVWYHQKKYDDDGVVWLSLSTTSPIDIQSSDGNYQVPDKVLRTAARPEDATMYLNFEWSSLTASQFYVYLHFAEIEELENGMQREIDIYSNNEFAKSLGLEYLKPVSYRLAISGNPVSFSIRGSDLPPILNAFEIFEVIALPNSSTAIDDVNAIMDIKLRYKVNRDWQGDPCLPSEYPWDGLTCSNDNPPRIISLNLSSSKLTGEIAASLMNLIAIQTLDLSHNDLTGPLPESLAQLPNLKILNLTGNKLTGSIPEALWEKSGDGLLLSWDKNPDLCPPNSCEGKKKKSKFVLPLVVGIVVLLFSLIALAVCWIYKRKMHGVEMVVESKKEEPLKVKNRSFTYSEIVSISDNFRTVIGEGGFGKVFLGTLKDDTKVAVKMLSPSSKQGYKEFQAEMQLLMIVHHKNLVSLIGYHDDHENLALIYEYMPSGNLRQHLSETNTKVLSWSERLQIAVDSAHGLEYLHNGCKPPIIHRDLKSTNILLNEKMQAKIADFGLSRVFTNESGSHISTWPAGTIGYVDPEIQALGIFNKKSDVYSFGIILLELITGRPVVMRGTKSNTHILHLVRPFIERGEIRSIIDPRLEGEFNNNSAWKIVEIAMSCVPQTAIQRPDMSQVLVELKECLAIEAAAMEDHDTGPSYLEPDMDTAPSAR